MSEVVEFLLRAFIRNIILGLPEKPTGKFYPYYNDYLDRQITLGTIRASERAQCDTDGTIDRRAEQEMKRYLIKILRRGDTVLSVQDFQIVVRRANGEVDIVRFAFDEDGLPRINADQMMTITFGDNTIEVVDSLPTKPQARRKAGESNKKTPSKRRKKDDNETIVGTF